MASANRKLSGRGRYQSTMADQLDVFDAGIRDRIDAIRGEIRCQWCGNPSGEIRAKGLCTSCYRWSLERHRLDQQVSKLPPKGAKDPNFATRHDLDVAVSAIELCKTEGEALNEQLDHTSPVELEDAFRNLSARALGEKKGAQLFYGKAHWFYDFSEAQRTWLWYLLWIITSEMNRSQRRAWARQIVLRASHGAASAND